MSTNLKDKAYQIIKQNILTCRYAPGSFLNEGMLMEEVGASRTPIREALIKLEQENFVRIVSKKGVLVCELSLKEISDVYQIRQLMEPQIIRLWGRNIDRDKLLACRTAFADFAAHPPVTQEERNQLDDSLHRLILDACQNTYLNQLIAHLYEQNQRIRIIAGQLEERMKQNMAEHLSITDHLLKEEYEEAALEMAEHMENAKKASFENLMKGGLPLY